LLDDSDESNEAKKNMLLACVLASKYLSNKDKRPASYIRKRMEWEKHMADLTLEDLKHFKRCTEWDIEHS